jgi:hypothetical protein
MAGTVGYHHDVFREPTVSGTGIASATNVSTTGVTMNRTTGSYSTAPYQAVQTQAVSEAEALSEVRYAAVTVTVDQDMVLSQVDLKAARGGTSTPRGVVVRSSADGYASNLMGGNLLTVRPNWTQLTSSPGIEVAAGSSITLRLYFWGPSNAVLIDWDDLVLTFSDAAPPAGRRPSAWAHWVG